MKRRIVLLLILLVIVVSVVPALAQVSQGFELSWHVLSGGGGERESADYAIDDVLGQWADGRSVSENTQIEPGFWGAGREIEPPALFLPMIAAAAG